MTPVLVALLAGLFVGYLAGVWTGLAGLVGGEIVRELRSGRPLPAHSLRGGRPFLPQRNGLKP